MASVALNMQDLEVTPIFEYQQIENIHKSEAAGVPVYDTVETVRLTVAGRNKVEPVLRADDIKTRQGVRSITYAEYYADAYRRFKEGDTADAGGTPLEVLRVLGATPASLSRCRSLAIHSVEVLAGLNYSRLKLLGMEANDLQEMAKDYLASKADARQQADEIDELRKRIAELEGAANARPADDMAGDPDSVDALRETIKAKTGKYPKGQPSLETLRQIVEDLG